MAAVIGAAQTLQQRWRELSPEQRASFLALIADETSRLAELDRGRARHVAHRGGDVHLQVRRPRHRRARRGGGRLGVVGQDEVAIHAMVHRPLPVVRGDRDRLRQVLGEPDRERGEVVAGRRARSTCDVVALNGRVRRRRARPRARASRATSSGVIFEKFGRAKGGAGRSRARASACSSRARSPRRTAARVEVRSVPGAGRDLHADACRSREARNAAGG